MGVTVTTVGRIYKGQKKKGFSGTEEYLAWEKFPDVSLIKVIFKLNTKILLLSLKIFKTLKIIISNKILHFF